MTTFRGEEDATLLMFVFQQCIKIELKHILALLIGLNIIVFYELVRIISLHL